jgi:GT2 family glycosyltransferase
MTLSVVFPHVNMDLELDEIAAATLHHLLEDAAWPREVIIVESGSPLADSPWQRRCAYALASSYDRVSWRTSKEVLSYSQAANRGLAAAQGDFLCILTDDCRPPSWWDATFVTWAHRTGGIVTACDIPGADEPWGALWGMPRAVYEAVGALDENFLHCEFEDQDYWCRAYQAGFPVVRCNEIPCQHVDRTTFDRFADATEAYEKNRQYMRAKWGASTFCEFRAQQLAARGM